MDLFYFNGPIHYSTHDMFIFNLREKKLISEKIIQFKRKSLISEEVCS